MNKKVTELQEAIEVKEDDLIMIVQENENKKVKYSKLNSHKYQLIVEENTTGEHEMTIPCYYKVGSDCLDIFFNGEKLIKSIQEDGEDGHYKEVGEIDTISNKILIGSSKYTIDTGDCFEFIVRGNFDVKDTE